MLCALPSPLHTLMELADNPQPDEAFFLIFVDAFLRGLALTGTPKHVLIAIRRHLQIVGAVTQDAREDTVSLEALLRRHDLLLGPNLGGLTNLFNSLVEEGDIFSSETFDVAGFDAELRRRLMPLERSGRELQAVDDVAMAVDADIGRVATCICLAAISDWLSAAAVSDFLGSRAHLLQMRKLLSYRKQLDALKVDFVRSQLEACDMTDFALWYLAHFLCGYATLDPLQRPLVDTLLAKVNMPKLAIFERAFACAEV